MIRMAAVMKADVKLFHTLAVKFCVCSINAFHMYYLVGVECFKEMYYDAWAFPILSAMHPL